eukprot:gene4408-7783_t
MFHLKRFHSKINVYQNKKQNINLYNYSKQNKFKFDDSIDILNPNEVQKIKIKEKQEEIVKIPKWTKKRVKFGKWDPTRKLSREEMEELKSLSKKDPLTYNFQFLSTKFKISPESVKRILKSKFRGKK